MWMESMLTLLSLAQFIALKVSEMDYFLKVLLNMVRDLSVSVSLSFKLHWIPQFKKFLWEQYDEMLMMEIYIWTFFFCGY